MLGLDFVGNSKLDGEIDHKRGQTIEKKMIENWHLIIYQGTLLHNGLPDIMVFTDSQIDKRKD